MEIVLDSKKVPAYKEIGHQIKYIQDTVDSVVPDTNEDIGKIAALSHNLLLKSKDITNTGVLVSGEINISLAYITEAENSVSNLKLSKLFNIEFEVADINTSSKAQIMLKVNNIESRIINPRKISVAYEIAAEMTVFKDEEIEESYILGPENSAVIKLKEECIEYLCPVNLCEKTFVINEQFTLPQFKNNSCRLLSASTQLYIGDTQHVGTKLIVKGTAVHTACYMPKDRQHPINSEYTSNFSQIIDTGIDSLDSCIVVPQTTSAYYDISESISNECILNLEVHAVLQIVCRKKRKILFVSDAYSNKMPCNNSLIRKQYMAQGEVQSQKLSIDEKLSVSDDCVDVLNVFTSILQAGIKNNAFSSIICFDIIYKNKNDCICTVRRTAELCSDNIPDFARLIDYGICSSIIRPIETIIDAQITVEFSCYSCNLAEYSKINVIELDEEHKYKSDEYPSITLVKYEGENLWDLAKCYHSSVDKILALNNIEQIDDKFVIIQKE